MSQDEIQDAHPAFIDRNCFGIPVKKWIDILAAIKADISNARVVCGGDGLGCKGFRGDHPNCEKCPMEILLSIREAVDGNL